MGNYVSAADRRPSPWPRITVDRTGWRRARSARGLQANTKLAEALEVSETTVWRVLTREVQAPGEDFIAKSLHLFKEDELKFEDLFTVLAPRRLAS